MQPQIKSKVRCSDGVAGEVAHVIADPLALDLSHHPEAQSLDIRPHDLETYDELARSRDNDDDEQ